MLSYERAFLLDSKGGHTIVLPKDIEEYHLLLDCEIFDITQRRIDGVLFDIYCDDMGLMKDDINLSAVNSSGEPMLVGNLIFTHTDRTGNTIGIDEEEINLLYKNMDVFTTLNDMYDAPKLIYVMRNVEYP